MEISSWSRKNGTVSCQIHPLLINHIVERILECYCTDNPSALLSMRQVCQVWDHVASKCHRKYSNKHIAFGKNFNEISESDNVLKSSSMDFPLGNFKLCPDVFQPRHEDFVKEFFFGSFSFILSSLVIRLDYQSTLPFNTECYTDIQLPRLKKIVVDDRRNCRVAFDNIFSLLLKASANSVESISLHRMQMETAYSQENEDENLEMISRICCTFENVSMRNLTNLQLDLIINDDVLIRLSRSLHSLRTLSLCLKTSKLLKTSVFSLLQSQSKTLENLRLVGLCKKSQFQFDFPKLKNLQVLEIQGWCHNIPDVEFCPFSIAENFPNLTVLLLDTWSLQPSWSQFLYCRDSSTKSLTEIKLPQNLQEPHLITDISITFTNIKVLTLHFQPSFSFENSLLFERVFETLGTLEELIILQSFSEFRYMTCMDSLITGLPAEECKRMLRVNNFSGVIESHNTTRRPSLINLKNLKCLDLSDVLKRQAMITDVTGYLLLNMNNLDHLRISRSKLRENCFNQLYSKFPTDLHEELNLSLQTEKTSETNMKFSVSNCIIM